jgi:hypothetical protein
MEQLPPVRGRGTRLTLVALGLFALLVIVAFATRAGFGARSSAGPSETYFDYAFSVFLVLFVLAIPYSIWAYYNQRSELAAAPPARRRPLLQTISLVVAALSILLILRNLHRLHTGGIFKVLKSPPDARSRLGRHGHAATPLEPHFRWPVLVAFAVLFAVGLALYVVARRRRGRRTRAVLERPGVREELAQAISDAIDDLEAEPDARRAVIATYARMEGVLARHGLPRRPSETPHEYLRRVLVDLRARAESVRRLTSLFERAKFSRHEIDAPMKREAIGALVDIRDDLRAAPA